MNNEGYQITYTGEEVQELLDKAGTAVQAETDPTVPSWAKASDKPSYSASEVGAVPTTRKVNNKALSADVTLSASDVGALPSDTELFSGSYDDLTDKPTIPAEQIQSDWNQSNTSAKDYIKNKPTIPDISNCITKSPTSGLLKNDGTVDTSTYLTSAHEVPSGGNAGQVLSKNSATDYDVHWVSQTTTYPSAYCTTAGGTALKVANCSLWTATANTYLHILMGVSNTYQGELKLKVNSNPSAAGARIYINGVVSSSTNYTLPSGSYIIFYDGTNFYFNTDGTIPNVLHKSSTSGLVKNDGSIDTNTYLTSAPVTSVNGQTGAVSLTLGDANVIETVKVNGSALTPDANKAVDITVPSVSGKEDTTNKVTSLSSSSTDTQYPSAKCVYDLIGDIETILASI